MPMSPTTRRHLATTIRALRTRLGTALAAATEGCYRLSVPSRDAGLGEAARGGRRRLLAWLAEQQRAEVERALARDHLRRHRRRDLLHPRGRQRGLRDRLHVERRRAGVPVTATHEEPMDVYCATMSSPFEAAKPAGPPASAIQACT